MACLALPSITRAQELEGPAEGFARVYFFHFLAPMTGRYPAELYADRSYIGFVDSSHTYGFDFAPGEHLLWSKSANYKWFLRANLEAGKTYYVHLRMAPGAWAPGFRPQLHPAARNTRKQKKILKKIESRLTKNKFTVMPNFGTEELAKKTTERQQMIDEVMATWDSDWSDDKKWQTLAKDDYVN